MVSNASPRPADHSHHRNDPRGISDRALLLAWRQGDRSAGDRLLRRHWSAIHAFFRRRVVADHDELAQRTFVACAEGCMRIRATGSFRSYLFGVAYNVLSSYRRQARRACAPVSDQQTGNGEGEGPILPVGSIGHLDVSALIDGGHDRGVLLHALRRLTPQDQLVLQLAYWEQMNSTQIARWCQIPAPTVRGRLLRARRALLRQFERLERQPGDRHASSEDLARWAEDGLQRHDSPAPARRAPRRRRPTSLSQHGHGPAMAPLALAIAC